MLQCLEKANSLSPNNPDILFLFSRFYLHKKRDKPSALHYAQLAAEYGRAKPQLFVPSLLRLMHNRSRDLTPKIDEFIGKAQTNFDRHVLMCLKARYLLQERKCNPRLVLDIFAQILQENPKSLQQMVRKVY